ncbi:MAG: electron transfer flavoprotein subunit alpha/FixB family protein [Thermoplasmata archaeon]|jgi:electron transfer flavoprotein alpha subunit
MEIVCIGEIFNNDVSGPTYEAIYLGNELKREYGGKLTLIIAGKDLEKYSAKLSIQGVDSIILLDHPSLELYEQVAYTKAIAGEIRAISPQIVIAPYTSQGMDLLPSIAHEIGYTLVTYCQSLKFTGNGWIATRVIYGGKLLEDVEVDDKNIAVTIRPGDFPQLKQETGSISVLKKSPEIAQGKMRPVGIVKPALEDIDITKYDVLVSVGRGIGSKENLEMADELAKILNGALACSRPIVDMGWLPKTRQVGSSAKTVKPKVYIALGISGATNHINGMKNSNTIISVNKDPYAPIFEISHYGVVADINDLLPLLLEELKK